MICFEMVNPSPRRLLGGRRAQTTGFAPPADIFTRRRVIDIASEPFRGETIDVFVRVWVICDHVGHRGDVSHSWIVGVRAV